MTYNLYADKLLKLNLFPASVYTLRECCVGSFEELLVIFDIETKWYRNVAGKSSVSVVCNNPHSKMLPDTFGIPLDTR